MFACWQVILKQTPDQQAEASERLMEFYRNPDHADFLVRVIEEHENLRFRQLAALGLRETCKYTDGNAAKSDIFMRLVKLLNTADDELLPTLLEPVAVCYVDSAGWTVLSEFINETIGTNVKLVVEVGASLIPSMPTEKLTERVGYFVKIIDMALNDPNVPTYVQILIRFDLMLLMKLSENTEISFRLLQEYRRRFSELVAKCIQTCDCEVIRKVMAAVWNTIDYDCYRFDLSVFFDQILAYMSNDSQDMTMRVIMAQFLGEVMAIDANLIQEDVVMNLVTLTADLSAKSIQRHVGWDDDTPVAMGLSDTFVQYFERLSRTTLDSIADGLVQKALQMCPYTGVLVVDALFRRCEDIMKPKAMVLCEILFKGLREGPPYLQELCCVVLQYHVHVFAQFFAVNDCAGLVALLKLSPMDSMRLGLIAEVVRNIAYLTKVGMIVEFCSQLIRVNDPIITSMALLILTYVSLQPSTEVETNAERIYEMAFAYTKVNDTSLQNAALLLTGVIMKRCPERLRPKLDQVYQLFLELCKSDDIMIRANGFCHFPKIFSGYPKEMAPIAATLLKDILSFTAKSHMAGYDELIRREGIAGENEFKATVLPLWQYGLVFVRVLLFLYPDLFLTDEEALLNLFTSIYNAIRSIFTRQINEGAVVLRMLVHKITPEMFNSLYAQFVKCWEALLEVIAKDTDLSLLTECAKAMLLMMYKCNDRMIKGKEQEFVDLCLVKIESQISYHTHEYIYDRDYHWTLSMLIVEAIVNYGDVSTLMRPFTDRLLQLYRSGNSGIMAISLQIITTIIEKCQQFFSDEVMEQLLKDAIHGIEAEDDADLLARHAGLLIAFAQKLEVKMAPLAADLFNLAQARASSIIQAGAQPDSRRKVENLVALMAVLDKFSETPLVSVGTMLWVLRLVPCQDELDANSHVYGLIYRRFNVFLETDAKDELVKAIFRLFTIPSTDIVPNRRLSLQLLSALGSIALQLFNDLGDGVSSFFDSLEAMTLCRDTANACCQSETPSA